MRIAAAARLGFQRGGEARLQRGVEKVQTFVSVAFSGQNAAIGGEELLEHGHLKHAPEEIAFQNGQFAVTDAKYVDKRISYYFRLMSPGPTPQ